VRWEQGITQTIGLQTVPDLWSCGGKGDYCCLTLLITSMADVRISLFLNKDIRVVWQEMM